MGNTTCDDRDSLKLRDRLMRQADYTLRDIAYHLAVPPVVTDYAIHLLRRRLAKRSGKAVGLEGVGFPQSYLNEAARNALRGAFKRAKKRLPPPEGERLFAVPPALCRRHLSYEEIMVKLADGLKAVTPTELKALDLLRRGYTPALIAITLGMAVDSVRAQLSTAKRKIHEIFRRRDSA
jgi:DNA-binding NarL/FixJ family response regulator